jgi:hypothetical protein
VGWVICTLRSVGAGERVTAPGHPVGGQQSQSLNHVLVLIITCPCSETGFSPYSASGACRSFH